MKMTKARPLSFRFRAIASFVKRGVGAVWGGSAALFGLLFSLCLMPGASPAQMAPLADYDLQTISGQAGISINMQVGAQVHMDLYKFSDSQTAPNWIELHNVAVDNGAGGNFFIATRRDDEPVTLVNNFLAYYAADPVKNLYTWATHRDDILSDVNVRNGNIAGLADAFDRILDPTFIDVATDSDGSSLPVGTTFVSVRDTSHLNPRWYSVASLVLNAYSTNITNTAYLSNTVGHYMTANALDNAGLISALGLSAGFDYSDPSTWAANDVTLLAGTADSGLLTLTAAYAAYLLKPGDLGEFHLQNQPLGSLDVDALRAGPSLHRFWAPTTGQGVRFDSRTAVSAEAFTYTYNTTPAALSFTGIHIAGAATGGSDDPATPSTWEFGGVSNVFKIGSIGDVYNTPATMDVATDSGGVTSVYMSLPAAGSIRVAEVNFGGNNFGPIAIDGIQFHRLNVKIGGL
ncbi:MAG: hypothetical protein PHN97_10210 [Smithellaceae bacterium]|nr:hypothetical protein [Smithellaceae bacterium]